MAIFLQLSWFFRLQWQRYTKAIIALTIVAGLVMVPPYVTGRLVDAIAEQSLTGAELAWWVGVLLVTSLIAYVLRVMWRIYLFGASLTLAALLRSRLYAHMSRLSPAFYHRHSTGDLMARATNDIEAVQMTAGEGVLAMVDGLLTGVVVLAVMIGLIAWDLTLIALIPWPLLAFYMYRIGRQLHDDFHQAQASFSHLNEQVQETLSGIRLIKALGREQQVEADFSASASQAAEANLAVARTESQYEPAIFLTIGSSFFLAVGYGGWLVQQEVISLGQLTSFTLYMGYLIWPMFAFGWMLNIVEKGSAAYERIQAILDTSSDVEDTGKQPLSGPFNLRLAITEFSYPTSRAPVLRQVNVSLAAGQTLGIVGPTGAGKTTLLNLIIRLYDGAGVSIHFAGTPLHEVALAELREHIAYVPQDPFLFSASIRDNIALARLEATQDAVEQAARMAAVHDDIEQFPQGYNTLVGERGVTLSGGQKQRIAIARALLMEAPVLILDDALSAVDVETESRILAHLKQVRSGCTTLIACHRLSAVEDADHIIVLDQCTLREQGTHAELLREQGWYQRVFSYQQLEQVVDAGR